MLNSLNKYLSSIILITFILITMPKASYAQGIKNINDIFIVAQQKTIINYEKSQPSSIDNPVVDPNFNVMRSEVSIIFQVIGLLLRCMEIFFFQFSSSDLF